MKKLFVGLRYIINRLIRIKDYKADINYGEVCMANVELHALKSAVSRLRQPPETIVEIGSYCGGSTVIIGREAVRRNKNVKLFAIEPFSFFEERYQWDYEEAFDKNISEHGLSQNVVKMKDTSHNVAKTWDKEINFLFIDGDHEYESVVKDIKNFVPFVKEGGLFAFHDYKEKGKDGVRNAVNELIIPFYKKLFYKGSVICFEKGFAEEQNPGIAAEGEIKTDLGDGDS